MSFILKFLLIVTFIFMVFIIPFIIRGIKENKKVSPYYRPLRWAIRRGNIEKVKHWLSVITDKGLNAVINYQDPSDLSTPIFLAVVTQNIEIIKLLLAHGSDVNLQYKGGITLLMAAAIRGNLEIIKLLLSNGADFTIRDNAGNDFIYWAKRFNCPRDSEIVDFFEKHIKKQQINNTD